MKVTLKEINAGRGNGKLVISAQAHLWTRATKGPEGSQTSQSRQQHGGARTSTGDFSLQDDDDGEQEVPLVQLQVRDGVRLMRANLRGRLTGVSAAGKMLM